MSYNEEQMAVVECSNNELLFRLVYPIAKGPENLDFAMCWVKAKALVRELYKVKSPETLVDFYIKNVCCEPEMGKILKCAYPMISVISKYCDGFDKCLDKISDVIHDSQYMEHVSRILRNNPEIFSDYDYTGMEEERRSLEQEIESPEKAKHRVRIMYCLKNMGIDNPYDKAINRSGLCRLLSWITGISAKSVKETLYKRDSKTKNYFKLNESDHGEDVKRLNQLIKDTKIKGLETFNI